MLYYIATVKKGWICNHQVSGKKTTVYLVSLAVAAQTNTIMGHTRFGSLNGPFGKSIAHQKCYLDDPRKYIHTKYLVESRLWNHSYSNMTKKTTTITTTEHALKRERKG